MPPLSPARPFLTHVRWLLGGTGAGKSTLARLLADRHDLTLYEGDRAEHDWLTRCTPQDHPHLSALREARSGGMWQGRTARQVFEAMPSLHGETTEFLVADLLALPSDRPVLVDWFGILPTHMGPLLHHPEQAVFLLPTPQFRQAALTTRYADPARARATWGSHAPESVLTRRLERDALWDEEIRRQAADQGLDTLTVDGSTPAAALADRLATRFGLV
ncbi:hypothetical protein CFP65_6433 [Kitasatospora sp. MMS16-BH015]|uniref:hypothetical protein n=1 Tax=Kitasatospora sp. MMS16-BH015 TaxID=2018025 RepID=UPI000CA0C28D|nr:hypothetical protein [Kitasatospora sp. MMS16-BH015]AUG81089.1 hypothetical protein CFP65_6433 [Kitasatospora sp. MMS16-BH015]